MLLRQRAIQEYQDRMKHLKVDPETGNRHIPSLAAKGTSALTTLVVFAGNGDSQVGRTQRDMGLHHVAIEAGGQEAVG